MNARRLALELLDQLRRSRLFADELLERRLARTLMRPEEIGLATELFYGCLRNKLALEFLQNELAPKQPRPLVADILKIGLYQIFFLTKIPNHAAVHETVELAKRCASAAEAAFVNAVLRRAGRDFEIIISKLRALRQVKPWVGYSHPRWLWQRWAARWGADQARALCQWNNTPPPLYMRINTLKTATKPGQIEAQPSGFHPLCWRLADPAGVFWTSSWRNGEFYVQDPSTLIAVDELDPQPGQSVLDMCAAPGGKTTYIAQKMQNRGRIIAADQSRARLKRVQDNCQRLGVKIVSTLACGGTELAKRLRGARFDAVLVDAPCSNTGVLRRRPDLRWRIEEKEIGRLAGLQQRLLHAAAALTKPGGVLVYSTCSLESEENERVVERFCEDQPQVVLETTRSVFPPRDGVDGAFVARLRIC